jgi:hypothetical protein
LLVCDLKLEKTIDFISLYILDKISATSSPITSNEASTTKAQKVNVKKKKEKFFSFNQNTDLLILKSVHIQYWTLNPESLCTHNLE